MPFIMERWFKFGSASPPTARSVHTKNCRSPSIWPTSSKNRIINIFESVWVDDLGTMWDAVEDAHDVLNGEVFDAAQRAVIREVEEARSSADATDSESTLDDHIKTS